MTGFISDIHGNAAALRAVLAELDSMGCDEIYSLGDVAGYYPAVNECCVMLRERNIPNLMGNHDLYLVSGTRSGRSRSVDMAIDYQETVVTPENLAWLTASALTLRTDRFFACHGGPEDPVDQYLRTPPYAMDEQTGLFLSGHTHIPVLWKESGMIYCNPGAVGQPRDGDPRASFAVLNNDGSIRICRVAYPVEETAAMAREAGFFPAFYECLFKGEKIT